MSRNKVFSVTTSLDLGLDAEWPESLLLLCYIIWGGIERPVDDCNPDSPFKHSIYVRPIEQKCTEISTDKGKGRNGAIIQSPFFKSAQGESEAGF